MVDMSGGSDNDMFHEVLQSKYLQAPLLFSIKDDLGDDTDHKQKQRKHLTNRNAGSEEHQGVRPKPFNKEASKAV